MIVASTIKNIVGKATNWLFRWLVLASLKENLLFSLPSSRSNFVFRNPFIRCWGVERNTSFLCLPTKSHFSDPLFMRKIGKLQGKERVSEAFKTDINLGMEWNEMKWRKELHKKWLLLKNDLVQVLSAGFGASSMQPAWRVASIHPEIGAFWPRGDDENAPLRMRNFYGERLHRMLTTKRKAVLRTFTCYWHMYWRMKLHTSRWLRSDCSDSCFFALFQPPWGSEVCEACLVYFLTPTFGAGKKGSLSSHRKEVSSYVPQIGSPRLASETLDEIEENYVGDMRHWSLLIFYCSSTLWIRNHFSLAITS